MQQDIAPSTHAELMAKVINLANDLNECLESALTQGLDLTASIDPDHYVDRIAINHRIA